MDEQIITGIVASARREGRFDVLLDGRAVGRLAADAVARLGLHVGDAVDRALRSVIIGESEAQRTYDRALAMLAARSRAVRELRLGLLRKGEPALAVENAIERLIAAGFLDDSLFARQYVRSKLAGAGFARRRLGAELARRGVAREVAEAAIAEVMADEAVDVEETIERVARRRLRTLHGDRLTRRRRLYGFLARRGYDADEIRRVSERLLSATGVGGWGGDEEGDPPDRDG